MTKPPKLAPQTATVVQRKDKPTYAPNRNDGDMCIVLNAKDICVTGRKLTDKVYYGHTGYIGHLKEITLKDQMAKDPTEVIHKVVLRMVPKNNLRDERAGIREVHFLPFNLEQIMILWNLREDGERKVHAIIDEFAERGLRSPAVAKQVFYS